MKYRFNDDDDDVDEPVAFAYWYDQFYQQKKHVAFTKHTEIQMLIQIQKILRKVQYFIKKFFQICVAHFHWLFKFIAGAPVLLAFHFTFIFLQNQIDYTHTHAHLRSKVYMEIINRMWEMEGDRFGEEKPLSLNLPAAIANTYTYTQSIIHIQ